MDTEGFNLPPRLLTLDEVAATMNVSRRTVIREIQAGHLRALHLAAGRRCTRVALDDLRHYLATRPGGALVR